MTSQERKQEKEKAMKLLESMGYYRDYTDEIAEYNGKLWLSHSVFPANQEEFPANFEIITGLVIGQRYNRNVDTVIISPNDKTVRAILTGKYRY